LDSRERLRLNEQLVDNISLAASEALTGCVIAD